MPRRYDHGIDPDEPYTWWDTIRNVPTSVYVWVLLCTAANAALVYWGSK